MGWLDGWIKKYSIWGGCCDWRLGEIQANWYLPGKHPNREATRSRVQDTCGGGKLSPGTLKMATPLSFPPTRHRSLQRWNSEPHFGGITSRKVSIGRPLRSMVDSVILHHSSDSWECRTDSKEQWRSPQGLSDTSIMIFKKVFWLLPLFLRLVSSPSKEFCC